MSEYCTRGITYESDKLPALSGLAARFSLQNGGTYLVGHWENCFISGLNWQRVGTGFGGPCSRLAKWRAPSWSLASIDGPISFTHYENEASAKTLELVLAVRARIVSDK